MKTFAIVYIKDEEENVIFYDNNLHNLKDIEYTFHLELNEYLISRFKDLTHGIEIIMENIKNHKELLLSKYISKTDRDIYNKSIERLNIKLNEYYENITLMIQKITSNKHDK